MSDNKRIRIAIVRSVAFTPLLPVLFAIASTIHSREADFGAGVVERLQLVVILLASIPRAIVQGRFPTLAERLAQFNVGESLLSLLAVWLVCAALSVVMWLVVRRIGRRWRREQWIVLSAVCIIVITIWTAAPLLRTRFSSGASTTTVEVSTRLGAMPTNYAGFSQGGEIEITQAGVLETAMQTLAKVAPRYVRIDHLLDYYNVLTITADGTAQYDWHELDRVVDAIRMSGAEPLMCLSYLPSVLAPNTRFGAPGLEQDWQRWEDLIYQTVLHYNVERKLNIRYWEVWNEPNLPGFWTSSLEDYLRLYEITARAAKRADPSLLIGGPGVSSPRRGIAFAAPMYEEQWIRGLVRFTQERQVPLDFISWHYYDHDPSNLVWSAEQHQAWIGSAPTPMLLTEWNASGAYTPAYDEVGQAAYLAAGFATIADSSFTQAFLFEPFDGSTGAEGRWGLMHVDGQPKPSFRTLELVQQLGGNRLLVRSNGERAGGLASRNEDVIRVLLWSFEASGNVTLVIDGLEAGQPYQTSLGETGNVSTSGSVTIHVSIQSVALMEVRVGEAITSDP